MSRVGTICLAVLLCVIVICITLVHLSSPMPTDPLAQQLREAQNISIQDQLIRFHEKERGLK